MFKQRNNKPYWAPKSKEEKESFIKDLIHPELSYGNLDQSKISNQIIALGNQILQGNQRLVHSNITRANTLNTLTQKGIQPVDIVIPVYGGLHVLIPCLNSIQMRTKWPYRITLVDDCSPDITTKKWLKDWNKENPDHQVIFHNKNKGFATAVNTGIKYTNTPYICILNSDVIVTDSWLTKMVFALEANPKNQLVNPITNAIALINVPLQAGYDYQDMNRAFELSSQHKYPEIMPTGFCLLFSRELVKKIGLLDEGYIKGYGEDTDYFMRCITHIDNGDYVRWRAVLADDTYIFHERSSSFSAEGDSAHMSFRKTGAERFHKIWPQFKSWQSNFDINASMDSLRVKLSPDILKKKSPKYNIAFVVFSTEYCGGMKVISDIVNELNEKNINAKVVHIKRNKKYSETPLSSLRSAPIIFQSKEEFINNFHSKVFDEGIIVAGTGELVELISTLKSNKIKTLHFAQSDEDSIAPSEIKEAINRSLFSVDYTITNSKWLMNKLTQMGIKVSGYVNPGYDNRIFYPRKRTNGDERPTVLFLFGPPQYKFRGTERGIKTCDAIWRLAKKGNKDIRILAVGLTAIPDKPYITCLGPNLNPVEFARLLSEEVDIICDPSLVHSYGLPSLEAMASGTIPVCWDNNGINEYATNGLNSIILPKEASTAQAAKEIYSLLCNDSRREIMGSCAIREAINHPRDEAIPKLIDLIETTAGVKFEKKNIIVITPHLRKFGGPTTILQTAHTLSDLGHNVVLYSIYPDISPEIEKTIKVPLRLDWNNLPQADILITNSDNPHNEFFSKQNQITKKVLLKLSHNERFKSLEEKSLNLKWDAIATSSNWLKCVCENVTENWDYTPSKAIEVGWTHYGYDTFFCLPENRQFRTLNDGIVIGTLAHHHPLKGTKEALESLRVIKSKYREKVTVITIGEWKEFKDLKPDWAAYVLNPTRKEMAKYMKQIDIWVGASHTEGLGRMGLEAMSSGCALVLTDTGGVDYAQHEENCLLTKIGDIDDTSKALDLLINDPLKRRDLIVNGYKTAKKFSDNTYYKENWDKLIKSL